MHFKNRIRGIILPRRGRCELQQLVCLLGLVSELVVGGEPFVASATHRTIEGACVLCRHIIIISLEVHVCVLPRRVCSEQECV